MKYKVTVYRTSYASEDFIIEADTQEEAENKAYKKAADTVFTEHGCEYFADNITELKED